MIVVVFVKFIIINHFIADTLIKSAITKFLSLSLSLSLSTRPDGTRVYDHLQINVSESFFIL